MVMMMVVRWIVVTAVQKVQILYWTYSLTHILNLMFSFVRASGTLLVHLTLSTNYLITDYCPKEFLSNISKKEMPTLDRTHRRLHHFST